MTETREILTIQVPELETIDLTSGNPIAIVHTAPDCRHYSKEILRSVDLPMTGEG